MSPYMGLSHRHLKKVTKGQGQYHTKSKHGKNAKNPFQTLNCFNSFNTNAIFYTNTICI